MSALQAMQLGDMIIWDNYIYRSVDLIMWKDHIPALLYIYSIYIIFTYGISNLFLAYLYIKFV